MKSIIIICFLLALVFAAPPIPEHPDGYTYSSANTKKLVRLDVYEDLLCIDCKHFEPTFKKYLNTATVNGTAVTEFIETVVHMFPLPYHHHAFFAAELMPFVYSLNNNYTQVFEYSDWIFSVQDEFNSGAVDLSQPQVQDKLCTESSAALGFFTRAACLDEFKTHAHDGEARISWKMASYYGVTGTPTVFLNGVEIDAPLSTPEWKALLAPYLESSASVLEGTLNKITQ